MSTTNASPRPTVLNQKSASPFAFHFNDEGLKPEKAVHYIPPEKRKQMKDYLSNSSINLSNVTEEKQSVQEHFTSTNKMQLGTNLEKATPYGMLTKERKDTIEKNRQRHIWMGRDNEFKKMAGLHEKEFELKSKIAPTSNNDLKERLRAHNFNFGYTDKKELERARVKSI